MQLKVAESPESGKESWPTKSAAVQEKIMLNAFSQIGHVWHFVRVELWIFLAVQFPEHGGELFSSYF